ncbi:MAG: hypothetical protein RLZZ387_4707 [Chloroflexota bacterium]|jgi:hypothetical protein
MRAPTPPWQTEIVELHAFFEQWLGGTLPDTDAAFARLVDTMAPTFAIVTPAGRLVERAELLPQLRTAHSSRPGWRMWIERPVLRFQHGALTGATYEEWQRHVDGVVTARLSTVIFHPQPGTPNGLAWLHVHETWLPPQEVRDA